MGAYNDDLLFIHIPKCAGTSVREWMKQYVPGTIDYRDEHCDLPLGHVPLKDIERFTGRRLDSFQKIVGIVRDPYTHQLSQWLFWRDRRDVGGMHVHDIVAARHPTLTSWLCDANSDFHVWYESVWGSSDAGVSLQLAAAEVNRYPRFGGYYRYWLTVDGEVPDNLVVLRMEELGDTWLNAVGEFAADDAPPLPVVNPGPKAITNRADAMPYYSPLSIAIVNDKFSWAFENEWYRRETPREDVPAALGLWML